jgi:glutathione synthase/RimK-type ligase-like ATP-grasp enzyme
MDLQNACVDPFELPGDIGERIDALMRRLGLVYGAIDMRLALDGRFVFLEVNPSGEWRFIEERSGLPITATLSTLLTDHPRERCAPLARSSPCARRG